jgi:outer membrane protein assembly factor BamE (lipoprotein component of BamABCDE complex)
MKFQILALLFLGTVLCSCTDTKDASGFTEKAFSKVRLRMSEENVRLLLGEPLLIQKSEGGEYLFHYTQAENDSNYHLRVVHFNQDRVVTKVVSEIYLD